MEKFKKILKILGVIFGLLALLVVVFHLIPREHAVEDNAFLTGKGNRPAIIAHGGGNAEFPDNTLEAYYHAYSIDKNVIFETDVNITKDGVIILCHDDTLDLTSDKTGYVSDWSYTDLLEQEVNFAYYNDVIDGKRVSDVLIQYRTFDNRTVTPQDVVYPQGITPRHETKFLVTTLEELITAFPSNKILVDIKQLGEIGINALKIVLELMARLDGQYNTYERIVIGTFNPEVFEELKEQKALDPRLQYSPYYDGVFKFYITHWFGLDFIFDEPVSVMSIPDYHEGLPFKLRHLINAAHRHNIAVHYWTINDEKTMRELAKKGADGIITDRPTLLKQVLDEMFDNP